MIIVTRLNKTQLYINPHLIEFIEETPDTVITMSNNKKIVVSDSADELVEKIIDYRKEIGTIKDLHGLIREKGEQS